MFSVDFIMRFEGQDADLSLEEVVEAFQEAIDDGSVWQLQGFYGRMAHNLIGAGLCRPGPEAS